MSDRTKANRIASRRDAGMTLPELLISVVLTGLIVTVIATASTVVLRTADNNSGRLNNARSEQNVNVWMPSDLTSAQSVQTEPDRKPCGPQAGSTNTYAACPSTLDFSATSNTMLLTWFGSAVNSANEAVQTVTLVSYRYGSIGGEWVLQRVECHAVETGPNTKTFGSWTCQSMIVLHEMPEPPVGTTWTPGTTKPDWVIKVTSALAATSEVAEDVVLDEDPGMNSRNAQRVLVTIDGGGDADGDGGGRKTFSFSAGGTEREDSLSTNDLSGAPTFTAARTRCGGNYGLIVDRSSSIGTDWPNVRTGVLDFIDTFAGKPVKLQIVVFAGIADTVDDPADSTDNWTAYFDMLDPNDVAVLKAEMAKYGTGSGTNWEDGWFRMLRNQNGTVRTIIPDKVIFFTDGMPNRSRLNSGSNSGDAGTATMHVADMGLSNATNYNMNQVAWNRTQRLIEETGVTDIVGVYIGDDVGSQTRWERSGAGYVNTYERGSGVQYQRGYTPAYERGNGLTFERGSRNAPQRGNTVVFERGYQPTYQVASGAVFARRTDNKLVFERSTNPPTNTNWSNKTTSGATITWSTYDTNNTVAGNSDGWRARLTGTSGASWSGGTITMAQYIESNLDFTDTDGFRRTTSGSTSSWTWTTITQAQYDAINETSDSTDGVRMVSNYTAPYTAWESVTESAYDASNTTSGESDGWRARSTGTPTSWTVVSQTQYDRSNTTGDETDGFRIAKDYSAPYTAWESVTWTAYDTGNTATGESDGWRARVTSASTSWTAITQAQYDESNVGTDESDGFRTTLTAGGTGVWQPTTQAEYEANNTTSASTDGWRTAVVGTNDTWTQLTLAQYNASNTTTDETDGWRIGKAYPANGPYDGYLSQTFEPQPPAILYTEEVLEELVAPDGVVSAVYQNPPGAYGYVDGTGTWRRDVRDVNMFAATQWSYFSDAIRDIALGECGGTVTIQTKNEVTGLAVADTFTYSNAQLQTVETSAAYKSGTFDVAQPGGDPATLDIIPQNLSTLNAWRHVSWTCTSQGATLTSPTMVAGTPDAGGWRSLTLQVQPNQAISCVQVVRPR